MQKITSRENAKIKLARQVRDGREGGLIFIEGLRLVEEALRSLLTIREVFVSETFRQDERAADVLARFAADGTSVSLLPDNLLATLADTKTPQGVVLLAERPASTAENFQKRFRPAEGGNPLLVLLNQINNPSNLGAILRTAEAAAVDGVIVTQRSTDVFSPKSLRASMGAAFRLNIWTDAEFEFVIEWSKANGLRSVAADISAEKSYDEIDWVGPRLVVFGSEAHGLTKGEFAVVDEGLIIPMENGVESLNLAVAAGIILFESRRQRRKAKF